MKHYTDHELQVKIDTFLAAKMEKYPELNHPKPKVQKGFDVKWLSFGRLTA